MFDLFASEWLFYGGIIAMSVSVVLFILCIVFFGFKWKKLKKKLEQDYGVLKH